MKPRQLIIFIGFLYLTACSAFFKKITDLDKIENVAIVSILLNDERSISVSQADTNQISSKSPLLHFNQQALLESSYIQLQNQIETQLLWDTSQDAYANLQYKKIPDEIYERLYGASMVPASTIYTLASGQAPSTAAQDLIRELCRQLNVDALVMMIINTDQHKNQLLSRFKKDQITPSVFLHIAIVDSQGRVVLNTQHFKEGFSGTSFNKKDLVSNAASSKLVLDAYKASTNKALEDYFYRSSVIIKRMGYQLSKIKEAAFREKPQQPKGVSLSKEPSEGTQVNKAYVKKTAPNKTIQAIQPTKEPISQPAPEEVKNNNINKEDDHGSRVDKTQRRSIWSFSEEVGK